MLADEDMRLVSLIGPGGTGKTRLALQAVAEVSDGFPDGVFWVPLAPLRTRRWCCRRSLQPSASARASADLRWTIWRERSPVVGCSCSWTMWST